MTDDDVKLPEPDLLFGTPADGSPLKDGYTAATVRRLIAEAVEREREACAEEVPNNWLDPLLTGPRAAISKRANADDIKPLLLAIRNRIRNRIRIRNRSNA